jgi:hypothetical protein
VTPGGPNQPWHLLLWEREWAPNATRDYEMRRLVLSSLPSQEFIGPYFKDGRVARHIYALRRRFFADSIEPAGGGRRVRCRWG